MTAAHPHGKGPDRSEATAARVPFLAATGPARTLACAAVVLVHVNIAMLPPMGSWWPAGFITAPLYGLAVPLFMIVAGYFARGDPARHEPPAFRALLRRRAARLLPPFLCWNAILLALMGVLGATRSPGETVLGLLTGVWQLYFVFALFQLLLLSPLLDRLLASYGAARVVAGGALVSLAYYAAADLVLWTRGGASGIFEAPLNRTFVPWTVFFTLGAWLRHDGNAVTRLRDRTGTLAIATVTAWGAFAAELRLEDSRLGWVPLQQFALSGLPFQVFGSLLALVMLGTLAESGRARRMRAWLEARSSDSYGIYLGHTSVLLVLAAAYSRTGFLLPWWLEAPTLAAATWCAARTVVRMTRRLPLLPRILLGERSAR